MAKVRLDREGRLPESIFCSDADALIVRAVTRLRFSELKIVCVNKYYSVSFINDQSTVTKRVRLGARSISATLSLQVSRPTLFNSKHLRESAMG